MIENYLYNNSIYIYIYAPITGLKLVKKNVRNVWLMHNSDLHKPLHVGRCTLLGFSKS